MNLKKFNLLIILTVAVMLSACQVEHKKYTYVEQNTETQQVVNNNKNGKSIEDKYINSDNCDQIIDKVYFKVCYDYNLKAAKSVAYTLEGDLVDEGNIEVRPRFYAESVIDTPYRAEDNDYKYSGYDRGHLAPDAAFDWSQESLEATYSLANIIPQDSDVNQHQWVKAEEHARKEAKILNEIHVINIVVYSENPKRIGSDKIAVSKGYYKVMYNSDKNYKECFYYENNASLNSSTLNGNKVDCKEALDI